MTHSNSPTRRFLLAALLIASACGDPTGPSPSAPIITALGPNRAPPGGWDFYLQVHGDRFSDSAVVYWNGSPRPTIVNGPTLLLARIDETDVDSAGTFKVKVVNADGEQSGTRTYTVAAGAIAFAWDSVRPTCCNEAGVGDSVAVYFNEAIDTTILGDSGLRLTDSGVAVAGVATWDAAAKALRFSTPLQALRFYTLSIGGQVRSASGGALIQPQSFDFVTALGKLVVIDTTGDFSALVLGTDGKPRIAYRKGRSRIASCAGDCTRASSWTTVPADPSSSGGTYTSFVSGPGGVLYLASQDVSLSAARVTAHNTFSTTVGEAAGNDGAYTSIAVAPSGRLHLFYFAYLGADIHHATCSTNCGNSANWTTDLVDSAGSAGGYAASVTSADGRVHLVYLENDHGDLKYATCAGPCSTASWVRGTIDSTGFVGLGPSFLIDGTGRLHLAYYDQTNGRVKYGTCDSLCAQAASWTIGSVLQIAAAGTGRSFAVGSLAMGPGGALTYAYVSSLNTHLESASCTASCTLPGSWTVTKLSHRGGSAVFQSALKIDAAGVRHLTWTDPLGWLHYMQY